MSKARQKELRSRARQEASRYMVTRDDESFAPVESFCTTKAEQEFFLAEFHEALAQLDREAV